MTASREDYLKAIYKLGGADNTVSNKIISDILNIAPPSVSEMLNKLKNEGLITYERYKGVRLTDKGKMQAVTLLRCHRLWEVFLIRHLEYRWSDAHEEAELLEHVTSLKMADRLNKFLNYPTHCPHGCAIPDANGNLKYLPEKALSELNTGEISTICRIVEEKDLMDYLEDIGIKINYTVEIISKGDYEGEIMIKHNKRLIKISHKAAKMVFVR